MVRKRRIKVKRKRFRNLASVKFSNTYWNGISIRERRSFARAGRFNLRFARFKFNKIPRRVQLIIRRQVKAVFRRQSAGGII